MKSLTVVLSLLMLSSCAVDKNKEKTEEKTGEGFTAVIEQEVRERYTIRDDCEYYVSTDLWVRDWKGSSHSLPYDDIDCATNENLDSVKVAQMENAEKAKEILLKKYPELK